MTFLLTYWKQLTIALILAITYLAGVKSGSDRVSIKWEREKAAIVAEHLKQVELNAKRIVELEETKNENLAKVDKLYRDNRALRLRLPTCKEVTTSGVAAIAGSGTLPASPQQALDRYTEGVGQLMLEADRMTEVCRVVVDWAKSIKD